MSAIGSITQLQSNTSAATTANTGDSQLGQDSFLKLMTAQMQNQDPFEPMDNGEFLSQIAQFGTVNGIEELKNSFVSFSQDMQSNQALQAANIIGHGVLVETNTGQLNASGLVQGAVELDSFANNVAVNVYNSSGSLVSRMDLGEQLPGTSVFAWDGTLFNGDQAPMGQYTMEVEVVRNGQTTIEPTLLYGNVNSLALGNVGEEMQVDVQGLGQVPFSNISKIL
ncbi:MAG: flagellar hook assembly protein FlgD [Gammaproteobacteria bacterium]|nr:flagellar hook assembly protein FlgD [Gammaproteobacteria bacterium]